MRVLRARIANAPPPTTATAIKPIQTAITPPPSFVDPVAAASIRLDDADGTTEPAGALVIDARGDGFAEDVGVGDTGTTVGLAVAVALVDRGRVGVGDG